MAYCPSQEHFNPIKYRFRWTADGWYEWDSAGAHKDALRARNAAMREAKAAGCDCRGFSRAGSLVSVGGIGSGHPHIEEIVTVYGFNCREK